MINIKAPHMVDGVESMYSREQINAMPPEQRDMVERQIAQKREQMAGGQRDEVDRQERLRRESEAQRTADLKSQGLNPDGSPIKAQFQSQIDPATGLLKKEYLLNAPNIDTNQLEGYQAYKNEALRKGPSAWLNMSLDNQKNEQAQANDDVMASAQQSRANTISGLAMRGGASSGARERALRNADTDAMYGRQKVGAQGSMTRSALGMKDEENRLGMLGNFSKGEADIARFNTEAGAKSSEFNILNSLRDREGKNAYDLETYKEQMQKWAAEKQAAATAQSGGGGK